MYNQLKLSDMTCRIRVNFNSAHIIIDEKEKNKPEEIEEISETILRLQTH